MVQLQILYQTVLKFSCLLWVWFCLTDVGLLVGWLIDWDDSNKSVSYQRGFDVSKGAHSKDVCDFET